MHCPLSQTCFMTPTTINAMNTTTASSQRAAVRREIRGLRSRGPLRSWGIG